MSEPLVSYMSPSAMMAYLTNPLYFKWRYVLKQYDSTQSVTGLIGKAGHKALERIYSGMSVDEAIRDGQREIDNTPDEKIKYGSKVPNRVKLLDGYKQAINFYVDELPRYTNIISIEEAIREEAESIVHPGNKLPTPLSVRLDLLIANERKEIEIIDHKFTYAYTNPDIDDFKRWIQSMFYYYAVKSRYGIAPARMRYKECKTSKNKDNTPQLKEWTFEYNDASNFEVFERLFTDTMLDMNNPGRLFLPNPADNFNGQDSFEVYRQDIVPVAAPITMKHRTQEVDMIERHFTPSVGNTPDTAQYTPEERIRSKLQEFGIPSEMQETHVGASVIQYTLRPSRGVPMAKIAKLTDDIAIALEARSVRIEAPIRGTSLVGVEVPSKERKRVDLEDKYFKKGTLSLPIGQNVYGEIVYKDLADMPHLLIAGATGAGKSVMLNVIIKTITEQLTPKELELILVDPKQVEFAPFDELPHLIQPVIYDNAGAAKVLDQTVKEMEARYKTLRLHGVRNINDYRLKGHSMPYRVVILDEFADFMMTEEGQDVRNMDIKKFNNNLLHFVNEGNGKLTQKATKQAIKETLADGIPRAEDSIIRIAQKARAVGIHLVLATQRPSADVVTGLIKANIPTKIAFMTSSRVNSQIILDATGAEELTGKGDMLYLDPSVSGLTRLQGLYA
jgi:hypothetical protein